MAAQVDAKDALKTASKYGEWIDQGKAGKLVIDAEVKMRVFCIPQAGMGAWAFHAWQKDMPSWIEIMPVELPGRGVRMRESGPTTMSQFTEGLLNLIPLMKQKPYVLMGHSLGAWNAYELAVAIGKKGGPRPMKLYVSGIRAPQLAGNEHDNDKVNPQIGALPSEKFWPAFENRYGVNPDLQDGFMKDYVLPGLHADFTVLEDYHPTDMSPLHMPLVACCGHGDTRSPPEQLAAWSVNSPDYAEHWFEPKTGPDYWGNAHRYLIDNYGAFLEFLVKECEVAIAGGPDDAGGEGGEKFWIKTKNGATLREEAGMKSTLLAHIPPGTIVKVLETTKLEDGKERSRLAFPLVGWTSTAMLGTMDTKP